ncbi:MAG: helix-turn-helix domain-containing protein [Clostridia bacterium]
MNNMSFGQRLVQFRNQKGIMQKELAEKTGITPTALNYYEKDKREPNLMTIIKLADALDVTGDDLLGTENLGAPMKLSRHERALITAYREQTDMQSAVDRLLALEPESQSEAFLAFRAAHGKDNAPPQMKEFTTERIEEIKNAPDVEEI